MAELSPAAAPAQPRTRLRGFSWAWLGVVPFFLFAFAFLLAPSSSLFLGSFQDAQGNFTLDNVLGLSQPPIPNSFWLSIQVSAVTAIGGGVFGFLLAYAVTSNALPRPVRDTFMTFCGVASNFAGVPLAFAFVATLGRRGFVSLFLQEVFGIDIYEAGFNLYSFAGLSLTYLYFQFPLMVLIMAPALEGLKREWREASENLGANTLQYWQYIGLPILLPSLVGTMLLLFGNAFGAYATVLALTGGTLNLVTIQIGAQIRGDVLHNPGLGYAMGLGMVAIMAVTTVASVWLRIRSERWLR